MSDNVLPGEVLTSAQSLIPTDRALVMEQPGMIAYGPGGGPYSGCAVKLFRNDLEGQDAVEQMNAFFTQNGNLLVVSFQPVPNGDIYVVYTKTLVDDELEVVKQRGHIIEEMLNKFRAEKKAAQEAADASVNAKVSEVERLATIGEQCEKNHGSVVKQLRAAKKGKK